MSIKTTGLVFLSFSALCCCVLAQNETIGDESAYAADEQATSVRKLDRDNGFGRGSVVANAGFMYGSSLVGGEFEFGVAKIFGLQVGGGFVGANAGANVHVFSRKHIDLYLSGTANYMPGLQAVLPAVTWNVRGFFGSGARVGVCGMIGVAVCTVTTVVEVSGTSLRYTPGQVMLSYAIGVPIKVKKS